MGKSTRGDRFPPRFRSIKDEKFTAALEGRLVAALADPSLPPDLHDLLRWLQWYIDELKHPPIGKEKHTRAEVGLVVMRVPLTMMGKDYNRAQIVKWIAGELGVTPAQVNRYLLDYGFNVLSTREAQDIYRIGKQQALHRLRTRKK